MGPSSEHHSRIEVKNLYIISELVTQKLDWKLTLDEITSLTRSIIIFDNLVVYLVTPQQKNLEVVYARAAGRGRSLEADLLWGETIASTCVQEKQPILQDPPDNAPANRLDQPYILAIPLALGEQCLGSLVFIRFGGPVYTLADVELTKFIAQQISLLIVHQHLREQFNELEEQHQQYRLQDDFVSTITHELRNPLGFIKGYTTTLLRSDTQWDQTTQQEFLKIIDQETDRLQELIDNLLDSARLQSGEMRMLFQMVRLDSVISDVIQRAQLHHPELKITVNLQNTIPPLRGDPRRLAQVFENIVNNAIKYAAGSEILITINSSETHAVLTFQDFGPGIPDKYLPFIFNRFFRSPETPNIHGSGLGLFICKQIIAAHHGEIAASSEVGKGTTFTISLPIRPIP